MSLKMLKSPLILVAHLYYFQRIDQRKKIQKCPQASEQRQQQRMDNLAKTDKTPAPNNTSAIGVH